MENYITHIEIKNLWGLYDIAFDCDPKVNILVGKNGSGKSTVLRKINDKLNFSSDKIVQYGTNSVENPIDYNTTIHPENLEANTILIDTFDSVLKTKAQNYDQTIKKLIDENLTPLDIELFNLIEGTFYNTNFIKEESKLTSKALKYYKEKNPNKGDAISEKLDRFYEILNSFFKENDNFSELDKKIIFTDEKSFVYKINGQVIKNLSKLSSGEKQLVIILINIFLTEEKPAIVFLDEPELSLDITWQEKLIETIFKINPNIQLFIATHSSSIFFDGWGDKMIDLDSEEIKKPAQQNSKT